MQLFVELIQVALGRKELLSKLPSKDEWYSLYEMAQNQAITGFLFTALEKLSQKGQKPPMDLLFEWIGATEQIKSVNHNTNKRCAEVIDYFCKLGYGACILKGQGNAMLYPEPLLRQSGDIDIWIDADRETIRKIVRTSYTNVEECGWHIDFPIFSDVPVEVHYLPSYLRHPIYDKRLQEFFELNRKEQFLNKLELIGGDGVINVPTWKFNVIQQMSHVMRHFFVEGIGLRQLLDMYYLLLFQKKDEKAELIPLLKKFGMYRFSAAIMWILHKKFGLEDQYLICSTNQCRGQKVLNEILCGGNFGRFDNRLFGRGNIQKSTVPYIAHSLRLMILFPEETIVTSAMRRFYKSF